MLRCLLSLCPKVCIYLVIFVFSLYMIAWIGFMLESLVTVVCADLSLHIGSHLFRLSAILFPLLYMDSHRSEFLLKLWKVRYLKLQHLNIALGLVFRMFSW